MSANGGSRRKCEHFHVNLLDKIVGKRNEHYSVVAVCARQKIMFSLINSIILCKRGSKAVAKL